MEAEYCLVLVGELPEKMLQFYISAFDLNKKKGTSPKLVSL